MSAMSKLSFRARALDASKSMPVYLGDEIPELPDFAAINRAVPQMPTGMEKEEETEHHLQAALSAQQVYGTAEALVIPVPEIDDVQEQYHRLYAVQGYKPGKPYIHVQPWGMDQEIPDYDMDSEDDTWLQKQKKKLDVGMLKFETMMDRLEKGSGQTVMTLGEAKALLKEDDDLTIAVYDYWLNKRLRYAKQLMPLVKTEKRDGSTTNNPYVAFRRRTEKMQTRKNRKNDEASYERMLKLRRDLTKALSTLEFVRKREKSKKETVQLMIEIADKRYQLEDWDGKLYGEALAKRHTLPPTYIQPILQQFATASSHWSHRDEGTYTKKTKREYKKQRRQHKGSGAGSAAQAAAQAAAAREARLQYADIDVLGGQPPDLYSSDDDMVSQTMSASDHEDDDPDGVYAFRRKPGVCYHAPINNGFGNWPWHGPEEGGIGEARYRYSLTSLPRRRKPVKRCIGFARRRIGRGGRVILDRMSTDWDDYLHEVDFTPEATETGWGEDYREHTKTHQIHHFRPKTPTDDEEDDSCRNLLHEPMDTSTSPALSSEFNVESFQNHQEQLLQMQRLQQEQLLTQDTKTPPTSVDLSSLTLTIPVSASSSKLLLDSAKAAFAASAVHNSATELICSSVTTTGTLTVSSAGTLSLSFPSSLSSSSTLSLHSIASSTGAITSCLSAAAASSLVSVAPGSAPGGLVTVDTAVVPASCGVAVSQPAVKPVAVQHNGPSVDNNKATNVFSTSPAANVLQLNYPLSSSASSLTSSLVQQHQHRSVVGSATGAVSVSSLIANNNGGVVGVSGVSGASLLATAQPQQTTVFSKLAAAAVSTPNANAQRNAQKEKHEGNANGSNNLLKDKGRAIDVT